MVSHFNMWDPDSDSLMTKTLTMVATSRSCKHVCYGDGWMDGWMDMI